MDFDRPTPSPPSPIGGRLPGLLGILIILVLLLLAPTIAEQIQYAITRGELRARSEAATAELSQLAKNAELVKLSDTSRAFRLVAERISPSVVHIDTEQVARRRGNSVFDEFGLFEPRGGVYRMEGQGSGVVVDKSGYIITNYHVIQDADSVVVKLADGRTVDEVRLVGYDVLTDLAVLKIEASGLIAATWGDSSELEPGDWVIAVGNPFGLDRTVTAGIVSAKQRRALAENSAYQNFLQTDAAVNPGNSGGPLVNISGEVIGITTAIVGKAYQGISFAIPSKIAQGVYQHIVTQGKVVRGYLGVGLQDVTPEIAEKLNLGDNRGALVTGVQRGSPADRAGIEAGDLVVEWDGNKVTEANELRLLVAGTKIDSTVKVKVIRDGKPMTLDVTVTARGAEK